MTREKPTSQAGIPKKLNESSLSKSRRQNSKNKMSSATKWRTTFGACHSKYEANSQTTPRFDPKLELAVIKKLLPEKDNSLDRRVDSPEPDPPAFYLQTAKDKLHAPMAGNCW